MEAGDWGASFVRSPGFRIALTDVGSDIRVPRGSGAVDMGCYGQGRSDAARGGRITGGSSSVRAR